MSTSSLLDAVDQRLAAAAGLTVCGHRLLGAAARDDSGRKQRQVRRVPAVQGQLVDLFSRDDLVDRALARLDERRFRSDGHRLGDTRDRQGKVEGEHLRDLEAQAFAPLRAESLELGHQLYCPGGTNDTAYAPRSSVTVVRANPVSTLRTVTSRPAERPDLTSRRCPAPLPWWSARSLGAQAPIPT